MNMDDFLDPPIKVIIIWVVVAAILVAIVAL